MQDPIRPTSRVSGHPFSFTSFANSERGVARWLGTVGERGVSVRLDRASLHPGCATLGRADRSVCLSGDPPAQLANAEVP